MRHPIRRAMDVYRVGPETVARHGPQEDRAVVLGGHGRGRQDQPQRGGQRKERAPSPKVKQAARLKRCRFSCIHSALA